MKQSLPTERLEVIATIMERLINDGLPYEDELSAIRRELLAREEKKYGKRTRLDAEDN